ncbi:MAG: fused DSP-PTPase phosphatase/NAD kinase-like protein [Planctomycetota bacterium]
MSEQQIRINDQVTVGSQPNPAELEQLARHGYKSVINLRTSGEVDDELTPDEEGDQVKALGMQYVNIPVSMDDADETTVDRFRQNLNRMPKPVYVHCARGKRAGAMTMMDVGVKQDMDGEEVLEKAEDMGFECDQEQLEQFVRSYVDDHTSDEPSVGKQAPRS